MDIPEYEIPTRKLYIKLWKGSFCLTLSIHL